MTEPTRWQVGHVAITKVLEVEMDLPLNGLVPSATPTDAARHPWLWPHFLTDDGKARLSFHALVVDTGERRILVDTCIGNNRTTLPELPALQTTFLDDLGRAGYPPDRIDTVVCTHLHFDHVGWNTHLVGGRWEVTFPRARHLVGRVEWEHWQTGAEGPVFLTDTVQPVFDAGLVDLVEVDHQVAPEVRLEPTPGHTPGHVSVLVESDGARAVITGDLAHHPLQLAQTDLVGPSDSDADQAAATRQDFVARHADTPTLVIGTHFAGPTAGRLVTDGEGARLVTDD